MLLRKKQLIGLGFLGISCFLAACTTSTTKKKDLPELRTVDYVDLNRYLGTWYEIASFPQRFQKGCTGTTANYSLRDDGQIKVLNRCFQDSLDGPEKTASGRARVLDQETNAKLEVTFFWPFWGDYWVIDLDEDYQYAVVGHPGRDYLWILNREPQMDEATYEGIIERLKAQYYDVSRLQRTLQPADK
ncbi:MAG: lipocalin family protein [Oligoflexus sp.]